MKTYFINHLSNNTLQKFFFNTFQNCKHLQMFSHLDRENPTKVNCGFSNHHNIYI